MSIHSFSKLFLFPLLFSMQEMVFSTIFMESFESLVGLQCARFGASEVLPAGRTPWSGNWIITRVLSRRHPPAFPCAAEQQRDSFCFSSACVCERESESELRVCFIDSLSEPIVRSVKATSSACAHTLLPVRACFSLWVCGYAVPVVNG